MEEQQVVAEEKSALPEKKRKNSEQDQRIQNDITEAAVMLQNIESDTELKTLLNAAGIDDDECDTGKARQVASQEGYNARQDAIGAEESATNTLKTLWPTVEAEAVDIREVLRARFTGSGDRRALGIMGNLPQDRQKAITVMRATYTECKKAQYQTILGKSGYDPAALDTRLDHLTDAENTIAAARKATADAKRATEQRNSAIKELRQWVSMVKRIAKRSLRTRPDLLDKLGF
ncbi:hypothetical protein [Armatimonas sp.]|uniref:hypothetical protein n=1 Tax=Armatimonas sp. TaxID=1872638 RepID=UPI00286AE0D6|nr:hypothetical protein [Armatimonas sp.]